MGAICGLSIDTHQYPVLNTVQDMLSSLRHRGNGKAELITHNQTTIGCISSSPSGISATAANADGRYHIAFDGDIYNLAELQKLITAHSPFSSSQTPASVILAVILSLGIEGLNRVNGDFAIVIYDKLENSLLMVRDRVGGRPLFYSSSAKHLFFASEIKAFKAIPEFNISFSPDMMKQILTFWSTTAGDSPFNGIKQVKPGCYAKWNNGTITEKSYWSPQYADSTQQFKGSFDDAKAELNHLLADAVSIRLNESTAAYLSGGLDSSITCHLINRMGHKNFNTFSLTFGNSGFDESSFQNEMIKKIGSQHHICQYNDSDLEHLIEKAIWHAETPLLRTGPIPMLKLASQVATQGFSHVITGEGADENLGGYNIFKEMIIRRFWARQPKSKYRPLLLSRLYPYMSHFNNDTVKKLNFFFGYKLEDTDNPAYSHLLRWRNGTSLCRMLNDEWTGNNDTSVIDSYIDDITTRVEGFSDLAKAQFIESDIFLPGYLLSSQGERMLTANSLTGCFPFMDYRVIEFSQSLPDEFKIKGLHEKHILKSLYANNLPGQIINRPKQPYRAPSASVNTISSAMYDKYLSPEAIKEAGIFDIDVADRLLDRVKASATVTELDNMAVNAIITTQICNSQFCKDNQIDYNRVEIVKTTEL